jgi:hypothetical protein
LLLGNYVSCNGTGRERHNMGLRMWDDGLPVGSPLEGRFGRSPKLRDEIHACLRALDLRTNALDEALREMGTRHGDMVYSELLGVLSNLQLDSEEAKRLWQGVMEHRNAMERRLGEPLDLRVALFRYFVEIQRTLTNPKIIELHEFEQTRESAYTDRLTRLRNDRFFEPHGSR